mmetsp:Transcript_38509/g.53465  ORF Transcript_38509/g.53465 Transcript_38509/m.53465 type:complete len:274 (-) Transcript_38509:200-1021(-)
MTLVAVFAGACGKVGAELSLDIAGVAAYRLADVHLRHGAWCGLELHEQLLDHLLSHLNLVEGARHLNGAGGGLGVLRLRDLDSCSCGRVDMLDMHAPLPNNDSNCISSNGHGSGGSCLAGTHHIWPATVAIPLLHHVVTPLYGWLPKLLNLIVAVCKVALVTERATFGTQKFVAQSSFTYCLIIFARSFTIMVESSTANRRRSHVNWHGTRRSAVRKVASTPIHAATDGIKFSARPRFSGRRIHTDGVHSTRYTGFFGSLRVIFHFNVRLKLI